MGSPAFALGTNINNVGSFEVNADPDFESTAIAYNFNGLSGATTITNAGALFSIRSTAYRASRTPGAADVKGWNQNSPLPVSMSEFMVE